MPLPASNYSDNLKPKRHYLSLIFLILWLVFATWAVLNRQNVIDWFRLLNYKPPASVTQLANQDTMNSYTKHLFYLNRPQLLTSVSSFRVHCPENQNTIVLGCYHPDQEGIFIYNVSDSTLAGVAQVTAAHEVLHAVYARLTTAQRSNLDSLLNNYYENGLTNPTVKAEVKLYQQTEPKDVFDEMSCTFGTEIANLPAPLEAYYGRYFSNRAAIVAYEQKYQAAFSSRQAVVAQDDTMLTQLKSQINSMQSQLNSSLVTLNSQSASLNNLRSSGNIAAYNAGVSPYNDLVYAYNANVKNDQALVNQYNQLVASRNQVAGQLTTLVTAIDTRTTPTPQSIQ